VAINIPAATTATTVSHLELSVVAVDFIALSSLSAARRPSLDTEVYIAVLFSERIAITSAQDEIPRAGHTAFNEATQAGGDESAMNPSARGP